jgi:cytidylate kinase
MRRLRVAIDGPAGAGKSTVARQVAERVGYVLVDTGALYRTVALVAQQSGVDWADETGVGELARQLADGGRIVFERGDASLGGSGVRVLVDGQDISSELRAPSMSVGASRVSAIPAVRAALLDTQRQAGARGGVVLEGRDIGTVVFPDAEVKFFLTASIDVRARRRFDELIQRGARATLAETRQEVILRDKADTERVVAPLRQADDAILVDSSEREVADVVAEMARVIEERARA